MIMILWDDYFTYNPNTGDLFWKPVHLTNYLTGNGIPNTLVKRLAV